MRLTLGTYDDGEVQDVLNTEVNGIKVGDRVRVTGPGAITDEGKVYFTVNGFWLLHGEVLACFEDVSIVSGFRDQSAPVASLVHARD